MVLKTGIFSFLSLIIFVQVLGQSDIDYFNKKLVKVLAKAGIETSTGFTEIYIPDSVSADGVIKGKFFKLSADTSKPYSYVYVGRVNSCRASGCSLNSSSEDAGFEYFDYYILFDTNKSVQKVQVFNYQATHGQEVTANGWLRQFNGHSGNSSLEVHKNIDAISGATTSVYAITADIASKTKILFQLP